MSKSFVRNLFLAVLVGSLGTAFVHAQTSTSTPSSESVTGGDPVPTKPNGILVTFYVFWMLL